MGASLRELDQRHLIHPFTDHADLHETGPHVIVEGEGVWVRELGGRRLLDGLSGLWCVNVGYGCERIVRAVSEQMQKLCYYPAFFHSASEPAIHLAERLASLAPTDLNHTLFCSSGSEANEGALKIIRGYWHQRGRPEKRRILARQQAYHGITFGATNLTGLPVCHTPFDLPLPDFAVHAPAPHLVTQDPAELERHGQQCIEQTRRLVEELGPETFGAVFVEPVQGAGGVLIPPDGYLKELRQLARDYELLFVADEVITAFGRLGEWFASSLWSLEPDLLTMAKGITSGYVPLGATMLSDEVADTLMRGGAFTHGHTYSAHPTCSAAALANLDEIEACGLLPHVRDDVGPYLEAGLRRFATHTLVAQVRALRLIGALELRAPAGGGGDEPLGARASRLCREEGVIVRGLGNALAVAPPLPITREEIDVLLAAIGRSLDRLAGELGAG